MSKQIVFNQDAKIKLLKGITKLSDAVTCTLGPNGRNVIIDNAGENPVSTKDGVTVARSIELENPIENIGAQLLKQAAIKTADLAGDGTTTTTLLASTMITDGFNAIKAGSNAVEVKRGIEQATKEVIDQIKIISKDITSDEQIKQVAVISANGDEEIGSLISEAMKSVGVDGVVTVEESRIGETSLEIVEGIQIDKGYKSLYFVTNNDTMTATLNNPKILLYNGRLTQVKELLPLLNSLSQSNDELLVIAEDIDGEALSTLLVNKMRGILKAAVVKAPDFGDRRLHILEDIATVTGGQVISPEKGMKLEKFNSDWLGSARLVTVAKETTTIVDGKGDADKIEERIMSLKTQLDKETTPYNVERLQERLGKLVGGVAIINVGGGTEIEMKEKKDRLDDALQATKAALDEGILPGAGVALLHARKVLNILGKDDKSKGTEIVFKACATPFKQILNNAGEDANEWWNKIYAQDGNTIVPNLSENNTIDAFEAGIIDPTKVVRSAIENAAAAAVTLLMTECVIHSKPDEKKADDMGGMAGFGM
jgi:chaperonin GroEL